MAVAEDLDARSLLDQTDIIEVNYFITQLFVHELVVIVSCIL